MVIDNDNPAMVYLADNVMLVTESVPIEKSSHHENVKMQRKYNIWTTKFETLTKTPHRTVSRQTFLCYRNI